MRQLLRWPVIATAIGIILSMLVLPAVTGSAALGPCTIRWIGASGAWETAANWREEGTAVNRVPVAADTVCIDDGNPLTSLVVTTSTAKTVTGIDNAEELRIAASVTLAQGGEIVNRGVFEMSTNVGDLHTASTAAPVERFVNTGTLRTTGTNNDINPGITVDSPGNVEVAAGRLVVSEVGVWPATASVAAGGVLDLRLSASSDPHGTWTSTGDGVVQLSGTVQPKTAPLTLGFAADRLEVSGTLDGSVQPIHNVGVLPLDNETIVGDASAGLGVFNLAAGEVRHTGQVILAQGAVVVNDGLWVMSTNVGDLHTASTAAPVERFVNTGTLRTTGTNNDINPGVVVDTPGGVVEVAAGRLVVSEVGVWPATASVAAGGVLDLRLSASSDPHGTWTSTGDGVVQLSGTVQPKTAPLTLGFAADRLEVSGTLDGSVQPIHNVGVLPLDNETIVGDASAGLGVFNLAAGEVRHTGQVILAQGAVVVNDGLWVMSTNVGDLHTASTAAPVERFVNTGTLRTTGTNNDINPGVVVDTPGGVVEVAAGRLVVSEVGVWPATASVAAGGVLDLRLSASSDPHGTWTSTGDGVVQLSGTVQPKTAPLTLGFAADRLEVSGTLDGSVQPIHNVGVLPLDNETIVGDASAGLGVFNLAAGEVRHTGQVILAQGAVVVNDGLWVMSTNVGDLHTASTAAPVERFVNTGTLRTTGTNNDINPGVVVDTPGGVVEVAAGRLVVSEVGVWPATASVAAGGVLDLRLSASSDPHGTWTSTGDGVVQLSGTVQPKTAPLTLGFAADRLEVSGTLDGSVQPIHNVGVLPLDNETIVGDASAGLGVFNLAAGEVRHTGQVILAQGAVVVNDGLWVMSTNVGDLHTASTAAPVERFVNTGTLRTTGTNNDINPGVVVDTPGNVDVAAGSLIVANAVPQVSGAVLNGGTWRIAGSLGLTAAPTLTTIASGASVELVGAGSFPKLSGLGGVAGSLRLSGGKDLTTGSLVNVGSVAVGPQSRLSVNGTFNSAGRFNTGIAGAPGTGLFGDVVATGDLALGGIATVERDPGYSPSPTDVFTILRGADVTSQFGTVDAPGFTPSYTSTSFVLNGTGSVPVANAGPDFGVTEATPPVGLVLDGTGSGDTDGTITSYLWTTSDSSTLTNATTAQAGFLAADDAAFTATLEVCDDDGLCDTDTAQVTVSNSTPTIALAPVGPIVEQGAPVGITATYTDTGSLDTHTATVDWGPGDPQTVSASGGTITATNTYAGAGPRVIDLCVTDDDGATACATAAITVVNTDPVAMDDAATTGEDTTTDIDVLSNDTDSDTLNADLAIASVGAAGYGATEVVGRVVRYIPAANFCGTDTFAYTVSDAEATDTGTVTVTVTCVPDAPVTDAGSDRVLLEGNSQTIFGSATDVDGDQLVATWSPAIGLDDPTLLHPTALAVDDAVTTYTLTACDPGPLCDDDTTTVTITNATPDVVTTPVTTPPGVAVSPTVTFTDRGVLDTHTATVVWPGDAVPTDLGTVTSPITLPARTLTETGVHVVQVCVTDDDGAVGCANQSVTVRSDAAPDALDDAFDIAADSDANALAVLANDTDADADPITIIDSTQPSAGGTVTCSTSSCTYTPEAGFRGVETFTYTVADGVNGEDTATVTLTVHAPNRPPVASLSLSPTTGTAPLAVTATIGGVDPDDDALSAVLDWGDATAPVTVTMPVAAAPAHTYATPGTYLVRLAVSDAEATDVVTAVVRAGSAEPLATDAGDDQVVALGETVHLDGSASRPTVGTGGASWVVRNDEGDPVASGSGLVFDWEPTAAGTYVASLSLTLAGEQDVDTADITVVDPASEPGLLVTVSGGGALLDGADVLALDADGVRYAGVTGGDGTTRLLGLPDGDVAVYAFAPGFLPATATAGVTDSSGSLTVDLDAGEVAQTVLESRRLTIDEIVALGIDPNDPDNQNVFEFEIHLAFTPDDPDPLVFTGYATGDSIVGGGVGGGGGGGFGVGTGVRAGGYTVYPTVRSVGGQPVIIWLVIPGEARWLKEFFEVRMVVSNLAPQPFTFDSGTASLDALPDGLALAPTAEPQQLVQSLPDIPAGGSAAATWIVRGDKAGDYELAATYAASLEPIGASLSMVARTSPGALKVWGGDALFMRVLAEERLLDGHPYRVVVEMENISDIPVYNLAVELKEEGKLNYIYQPREQLTRSIAELAPGETLTADYVLVPTVGIFTPLELVEEISFVKKTGGNTEIASEIVSVPPRFTDAARPAISVSRNGGDVTITWAAVPGATEYQLFTTSAPEIAFDTTPIATAPAGATSITLPLTAALIGKHIAVSPTVDGRPDMVHRRVALLGGSFVSLADEPTAVDRVAIVGDGLMAGAGLAGADSCGRSSDAFATVVASELGATGRGAVNTACDGATAGNVAFAPPGPSLDDEYVTGPQAPLSTTTQAQDVATFAAGGDPDLVLAGFGAEDLGLEAILGQCGIGCDTRWLFTAQQVLRDRVYPRVYENLRALRASHPDAVVVAFGPPTPVAAGSACASFGTGAGINSAESRFLADELYPWLHTTMRRAAINAGVNFVDVTPALAGHGACSAEPWVNGLLLDGPGALAAGSFLPNAAGHEAIAAYLRGVVVDDGLLLLGNPQAQVLRVLALQEEAPFVVPVTAVQADACESGTCPLRVTVRGLRNGDRVDLLVDGLAPVPAEAAAGPDGTVDVTVQVPAPAAPSPVVVEVSSIDRNLRGSTVATIGVVVNRAPAATPDSATVDEDDIAVVDVLANDTDPDGPPITVLSALVAGPAHGTAVVSDDVALGRRVVRYQPAAGYCGPDSFTYEIADPGDLRSTATVSVTVVCVNDAPTLVGSDPVTVAEGTTAPVGVGVIDTDSSTFSYSWTPTTGLTDPSAATPSFTPADNGATAFAVTVCDDGVPQGCTTLANAAVVVATNVAPGVTAAADATVRAGLPLGLAPIATYTDPGTADTHTATVTWGDGAVDGPAVVSGGTVSATHTYTTAGSYTASVCVTDDDSGSTCDTLAVTVQPAGPAVSVGDISIGEPDGGFVNVQVPVSLSVAPTRNVSVRVETVDGSAVAGSDYTAKTATVTFTPSGALTRPVAVAVRGDLLAEPNETFTVRVVEPATVDVLDGTGIVTITNDDECTVLGTSGNDTLSGTAGDDVICAYGGDDVIDGLGGDDEIRGDGGIDTVTYLTAPAGVVVDLAAGTASDRGTQTLVAIEQVYGSEHDDTLTGGTGAELLVGLGGADTIIGGAGNDELDGGDGADLLTAGDGVDHLYGGDGADQLFGQAGNDRLDGEAGDDLVDGGDGLDVLRGGSGVDSMSGGLGTDDLSGGAGDDVLAAGDGNDTVQGDDGNDTITGGIGDDLLLGDEGDDNIAGEAGRDRLNGGRGINLLDGGDGVDSCRLGSTAIACERP